MIIFNIKVLLIDVVKILDIPDDDPLSKDRNASYGCLNLLI